MAAKREELMTTFRKTLATVAASATLMTGAVLVAPTAQAATLTGSMPGCSAKFVKDYTGYIQGRGKCGSKKWTVQGPLEHYGSGKSWKGKINKTTFRYTHVPTEEGPYGLTGGTVKGKLGKHTVAGKWKTTGITKQTDSGKVKYKGKTYKFKFTSTMSLSTKKVKYKTVSVRNNKGKKLKANNGLRIYLSIIDFRKGSL